MLLQARRRVALLERVLAEAGVVAPAQPADAAAAVADEDAGLLAALLEHEAGASGLAPSADAHHR